MGIFRDHFTHRLGRVPDAALMAQGARGVAPTAERAGSANARAVLPCLFTNSVIYWRIG